MIDYGIEHYSMRRPVFEFVESMNINIQPKHATGYLCAPAV